MIVPTCGGELVHLKPWSHSQSSSIAADIRAVVARRPHWHLIGTAVIFAALLSTSWLLSLALHALHSLHPFPPEIFKFISKVEVYLVYLDAAVSGFVLLVGMSGFCRDILEGRG